MTEPLARVRPYQHPDSAILLRQADAHNEVLYGHPDQTPLAPDEFEIEHGGAFLVAYEGDDPIACGGYRRFDATTAEIKRMFVTPAARRSGIGRYLLGELERHAKGAGYRRLLLDSGSKQHEAHALYEAAGYTRAPSYGIYRDKPGNRAYQKHIA